MKNKIFCFICSFLAITITSCGGSNKPQAPLLDKITVSPESKINYLINESFTNPIVIATYTDQTSKDVSSACTYSGFSSTSPGDKNIKVTYTENVNHFWVRTKTSTASGYIDIQPTT